MEGMNHGSVIDIAVGALIVIGGNIIFAAPVHSYIPLRGLSKPPRVGADSILGILLSLLIEAAIVLWVKRGYVVGGLSC